MCHPHIIADDLSLRFILGTPDNSATRCLTRDFTQYSVNRMLIQMEEAWYMYLDHYCKKNHRLKKLGFGAFVSWMFHHCDYLSHHKQHIKQHISLFRKYKTTIPVYGACVFNDDHSKVLLIRAPGAKSYNFPRGKVNQSEEAHLCAIREVKEETGITLPTYSINRNLYVQKGNVTLFIVTLYDDPGVYTPSCPEEIEEIGWHKVHTIMNSGKPYMRTRSLVAEAIEKCKKQESTSIFQTFSFNVDDLLT
jgi:8-oxo-dGTP pyrophosphatase MutT (NUDIX family)